MAINKTNFLIVNDIGKPITGDIYFPEKIFGTLPLIVISHGFKGFKDWGFFPYISENLAGRNSIVICFNFSLNGNPKHDLIISNVEDFANNTITQEVRDLELLINSFTQSTIREFETFSPKWNREIYLLGHSLGGGISLIVSSSNSKIKKVALWASIAVFDRYTERQKREWKKQGFLAFTNIRTNQLLKMNTGYIEDIEKNEVKYDLSTIVSKLNLPVFLIHGKQDVTVPIKETQMLIDTGKPNILTYKIIEKTGHTFGIEHPFINTTPALEEAINLTSGFFQL